MKTRNIRLFSVFALALLLSLGAARAVAHCDTLDGPVVEAARAALDHDDVDRVLIWVRERDEAAIRDAFNETLAVRELGPQARRLADHHFFETVVRLHRAGEGEPFTGLKPAGLDFGPALPAADRAVSTGDLQPVEKLIVETVTRGLREHFDAVMAKDDHDSVETGREYVEAYVKFIHYVEQLYEVATHAAPAHMSETDDHAETVSDSAVEIACR